MRGEASCDTAHSDHRSDRGDRHAHATTTGEAGPAAGLGRVVHAIRRGAGGAGASFGHRHRSDGASLRGRGRIHLGGLSGEGPWADILDVNINGTYTVLEAARRQGVRRIVFASSNHAVGFHPRAVGEAGDYLFPRPGTNYGVSKVAGEALCGVYADRYGMDILCVRIGSCFEKPRDARTLSTWLSPDDGARLRHA
jgi:nucleoside-diphosphate-sugar epimerase